jgi:acyl-coenzyme A synthetase/AMP-(fatty) acid ligase
MKIIQNLQEINITDHVKLAEKQLKDSKIYVVNTQNYIEHIAAYIAWSNVGGNIFVKSTLLPEKQSQLLDEKISNYSYENTICFHTSGTTGVPKLVIHNKEQMDNIALMATSHMRWDSNTRFLNFFPAATSGFWHIVLAPALYNNATIILGSRETMMENLNEDANYTILVPSLIDMIRMNNMPVDLSRIKRVGTGASAVSKRHAEILFSLGATEVNQLYGATEIGSPSLYKSSTSIDEHPDYLELKNTDISQFKLVNNELYVKSKTLCVNYKDFSSDGEWFKTNDLWEQKGSLIKFAGRSNDIVKLNGYQCSLLLIESTIETNTNLGEVMAIPRNKMGTDYIEVAYTNNTIINKQDLNSMLESHVPAYSIPRKYTYVESLPKTSLGKKIRNVL